MSACWWKRVEIRRHGTDQSDCHLRRLRGVTVDRQAMMGPFDYKDLVASFPKRIESSGVVVLIDGSDNKQSRSLQLGNRRFHLWLLEKGSQPNGQDIARDPLIG